MEPRSYGGPAVEALFRSLPPAYAAIARALRATIRAEAPTLRETVKWENPFWVGRAPVVCLQCYPDHVNFGLLRGAELAHRFPRIEGSGQAMRHVKVPTAKDAKSPEIRRLIRAAVALDRSGA